MSLTFLEVIRAGKGAHSVFMKIILQQKLCKLIHTVYWQTFIALYSHLYSIHKHVTIEKYGRLWYTTTDTFKYWQTTTFQNTEAYNYMPRILYVVWYWIFDIYSIIQKQEGSKISDIICCSERNNVYTTEQFLIQQKSENYFVSDFNKVK